MKEAKCAKCGKLFIPAPQHALVDVRGMYCSCTCFLHRKDKVGDGRRKEAYKVEQYTLDGEYIKTFDSVRQVAEIFGIWTSNVATACRKGTPYKGYLWRYKKDSKRGRDNG